MFNWPIIKFQVPAMSFDVYTKTVAGKRVRKVGADGNVITVTKIIPKERPRFGRTLKGKPIAFNSGNTTDFEAWIRRHFFSAYPSSGGVYWNGKGWPVHDYFLGCEWLGENRPCSRFKSGKDFLDCQACVYRRKNLGLYLQVHLKDDRHLDLDNVLKIVLDALNKTFFYDDMQFMRKGVELVPYSKEGEHLDITVYMRSEQFINGSLIGGYSIKHLSIEKAKAYIKFLLSSKIGAKGGVPDCVEFVDYLFRCDNRKYISSVGKELSWKI